MSYLEVPGASLYYESIGDGPILLCISGANGNVEPWKGLAEYLRNKFTVVMYDRRGFSRSYLSGAQDYSQRIETDADDSAALIKHLSPNEPATVLANSSGAVVGLELLNRHPDVVQTLISHEPPALSLLPDFEERIKAIDEIYDIYRQSGMPPALERFAKDGKVEDELPALVTAFDPRIPGVFSNTQYWFERELKQYPRQKFDIETFKRLKHKLILAGGEMSNKEAGHYRPNVMVCEHVGLEITPVPGGHFGFATHAEQFAQRLIAALEKNQVQ